MCFSGGGGRSAPAPAPRPAPTGQASPREARPLAPISPTQFTGNDNSNSGPAQQLGGTLSQTPAQSSPAQQGQVSASDVLGSRQFFEAQAGDGAMSEFQGKSPFNELDKSSNFYNRRGGRSELPGDKVVIDNQMNAPDLGGGAPGVGSQGFGERALIGGDAVIASGADPQSFVTDNSMPAIAPPSDVARDPNYIEPGANRAYNVDMPYNMPMVGGSQNTIRGFSPNDPRVALNPGGPISRNLSSARTGYGRRFV